MQFEMKNAIYEKIKTEKIQTFYMAYFKKIVPHNFE